MFAGSYDVYDSAKSKLIASNAESLPNGTFKNFKNYKNFRVVADYSVQREEFDLMVFESEDGSKNGFYSFKFSGEDFYVYDVIGNGDDSAIGPVKYFSRNENKEILYLCRVPLHERRNR